MWNKKNFIVLVFLLGMMVEFLKATSSRRDASSVEIVSTQDMKTDHGKQENATLANNKPNVDFSPEKEYNEKCECINWRSCQGIINSDVECAQSYLKVCCHQPKPPKSAP